MSSLICNLIVMATVEHALPKRLTKNCARREPQSRMLAKDTPCVWVSLSHVDVISDVSKSESSSALKSPSATLMRRLNKQLSHV